MTNKDQLIKMINNLNENGLNLLVFVLGDMDKNEKYNKSTTLERLEEIEQIEKQEEKKLKAETEAKRVEAEAKHIAEENKINEHLNKYSGFFKSIESTNVGNYYLKGGELDAIFLKNKGTWLGLLYDGFRAGFLRGQRAEKARQKRLREKARVC